MSAALAVPTWRTAGGAEELTGRARAPTLVAIVAAHAASPKLAATAAERAVANSTVHDGWRRPAQRLGGGLARPGAHRRAAARASRRRRPPPAPPPRTAPGGAVDATDGGGGGAAAPPPSDAIRAGRTERDRRLRGVDSRGAAAAV